MRISDWSSDVCSSDLRFAGGHVETQRPEHARLVAWERQVADGEQERFGGVGAVHADGLGGSPLGNRAKAACYRLDRRGSTPGNTRGDEVRPQPRQWAAGAVRSSGERRVG